MNEERTRLYWAKMAIGILDDRRLIMLPESARLRFMQLILVAQECGRGGYLIDGGGALPVEDIAARVRAVSLEQVKEDIEALLGKNLIGYDEEQKAYYVVNFSSHQDTERKKAQRREATRRWRERKKAEAGTEDDQAAQEEESGESGEEEPRFKDQDWDWIPEDARSAEVHPAVKLYRIITGRFPGQPEWEPIVTHFSAMKESFKTPKEMIDHLRPYWEWWRTAKSKDGKPYLTSNPAWIVKARNNEKIPSPGGNGRIVIDTSEGLQGDRAR